jgi:hypothetical protein
VIIRFLLKDKTSSTTSVRSDPIQYVHCSIGGSTARNSPRFSIGRANSSARKRPIDFDAGKCRQSGRHLPGQVEVL